MRSSEQPTSAPALGEASPRVRPHGVHAEAGPRRRRRWTEAAKLGAALGLPVGFVPASLLLELAPHLGFARPALWSFGGSLLTFVLLARARSRWLPWLAAGAVVVLLVVGAVLATAWTLTQSVGGALA